MSGDPASVSHLAGACHRSAEVLRAKGDAVEAARGDLESWRGRVAVRHRRQAEALSFGAASAAVAARELGRRLQDYATVLSQTQAEIREIEQAAKRAGVEMRAGLLVPRWGITGEADVDLAQARDQTAHDLQARWRTTVALAERRAAQLRSALLTLDHDLTDMTVRLEQRLP